MHNLRLLDISCNHRLLPRRPSSVTMWSAGNIAAFECGCLSLQVLGILSRMTYDKDEVGSGLRATAKELQRLLQRQADAAEPRRPPATVVWDRADQELLGPARDLGAML